jgi:Flp pilus assembly protein TadD
VKRDNWLFATFGLLLGFILGYVLHEVMAARQPPRLAVGASPQIEDMNGAPRPAQAGGPGAGAPAGGPPMAEIQELRAQVEKNPNDTEALLRLANMNFDIKNWQRASELYERYLKLQAPTSDVLTDFGVTLREQGQAKEALAQFERAATLSPTHWQSRFNKAVVLGLDLQDYAGADRELAQLRVLQPSNPAIGELAAEIERRKSAPPQAPPGTK